MTFLMPDIAGVTISEHQIRGKINGVDDTSLENIAKLYNEAWKNANFDLATNWKEIADLNFGGHTVSIIYDWLSTHGGTRQGKYSGHKSGYHWSFTPGQVLKIPGPISLSYPDSGATVAIGDPNAPIVDSDSTPSSPSGESQAVPKEETKSLAQGQTGSPIAKAGMGITGWLIAGGLLFVAIAFSKKDKKKSATRRYGKRR
jgi:hypothetical protein